MIPEILQPAHLLAAYASGAFPMADDQGQVHWFSPDPRAVIELSSFKVSRSLRQRIRKGGYETRINGCFDTVIRGCADREEGTWISDELMEAYCCLHRLGFAHSVETYYGAQLAGGLYGVSLAGAFFGESMFTRMRDGSKLALVALVERLRQRGLVLLDTQFLTPHLESLGAREIPRREYLRRLRHALSLDVRFAN